MVGPPRARVAGPVAGPVARPVAGALGLLALVASSAPGCGEGASRPDAASPPVVDGPRPPSDAGGPDAVAPLTWLDFTAIGCATLEETGPTCRGVAPLALRFAALSSTPVDAYLWAFGDGDTSSERTPGHVFGAPGAYTVTLTAGGPGGTAQARHERFVIVEAGQPGAACDDVRACASGLECVCGAATGVATDDCPGELSAGLCARGCDPDAPPCEAGQVCADLAASGGSAPWRRRLCLRACADDAGCPERLVCRDLRHPEGEGWVRGCFVRDVPLDVGASCFDAMGQPDGTRCASGTCAPLGARGLCTASCGAGEACPSTAACATFGAAGLGALCVSRCADAPCPADPWLACEAPAGGGDLGFDVAEPPSAAGYCAPRRCATAAECGTAGACLDRGGADYCGPR